MAAVTKSKVPRPSLYALLSATIGDDKAMDAVEAAARKLGLPPVQDLTMKQALEVLDEVANTPGIVGITARFAKSRLHLAAV